MFEKESQVVFEDGYFYETGLMKLNTMTTVPLQSILPKLEKGYEKVTQIIQNGGITTIADLEVLFTKANTYKLNCPSSKGYHAPTQIFEKPNGNKTLKALSLTS